jgi:ribosomal protein S18 acetylase RimI-like enzyme
MTIQLHLQHWHAAEAIVIDSPSLIPQQTIASPQTHYNPTAISPSRKSSTNQFRVRKTKSDDIHAISTMLAMASTSTEPNHWKYRIQYLAVKSSLEKQLHNRWNAIEEGQRTMLRFQSEYSTAFASTNNKEKMEECPLDATTTCHVLWSNDNFRSKLKSAVASTSERNAWNNYNFDYTPVDVSIFNHAMMTVVTRDRDNHQQEIVVGFCEVAWLPRPSCWECMPCIVNLVTCPLYRKRGIASKLMDVAMRYVRTQWCDTDSCYCDREIGLYVHAENEEALYLYRRKGFSVKEEEEDGLLHMSMRL